MTKVEAIAKVMEENGGVASLDIIYKNIIKYYPSAKKSKEWAAGIRGVLYRELKNNRRFKKIGLSIYALSDYQEEQKPDVTNKVRMHSYIEGICIELGNLDNYFTYTADPSAIYRDHLQLRDFTTMPNIPNFSYKNIVDEAKYIDVIWFNRQGFAFPQRVFEVVDSISTLNGAFNRSLQLQNFNTKFTIVAPERHRNKYEHVLELEIYQLQKDRFKFVNYDEIIDFYETSVKKNGMEMKLFG